MNPAATNTVPDAVFWRERRVLITGHTGFKGSWLTFWLSSLGANILGLSLPDLPTQPSLWNELDLRDIREIRTDVSTPTWLDQAKEFSPEIVIHLAAQPLVSVAHKDPVRTFQVNVQGTVQVMNLVDQLDEIVAALIVTTDKVFDPLQRMPYEESSFLGGNEPYSASKAAAELVVRSWPVANAQRATARAGNVIGGGDWAEDRLLPDLVRAWGNGVTLEIRNPYGVRPWQHVLEPLRGYLLYVEALAAKRDLSRSLNFGPTDQQSTSVRELVRFAETEWIRVAGDIPARPWIETRSIEFAEASELSLRSQGALEQLGWHCVLDWREALTLTLDWYCGWRSGTPATELVSTQLKSYIAKTRATP